MFKIGQKVVALKTSSKSVTGDQFVKGETYTVESLQQCPVCKKQMIIVEEHSVHTHKGASMLCCLAISTYTGKPLGNAKFFAPLQSYPSAISEILKKYPINENIETDIEVKELQN